ncbi:MAG: phosphoribosylamine--glycine ligase, partial [Candidatus Helarchaeota archaeon]|nr:phosphoribosylamine--glycine ligase [Candidatus Helarchaeota archaeon]
VGPEALLAEGIVDEFQKRGLRIFGPNQKAAQIETSKIWAKDLMNRYGIPTAKAEKFSDPIGAKQYLLKAGVPIVVKEDGLAAGKGVVICHTLNEAFTAVNNAIKKGPILLEEFLEGPEITFQAIVSGTTVLSLLVTQDCKPIYEGGPNTGGMWAYTLTISDTLKQQILTTIIEPVVRAMAAEGILYQGLLYGGLIVTSAGPKVLEFNARFGDPELQPLVLMMKSDIVPVFEAVIDGNLAQVKIEWYGGATFCLVMASGGYPGSYEPGKVITGLDKTISNNSFIFHAGTRKEGDKILTDGGRVLGIAARANNLLAAIDEVEQIASGISWAKEYHRTDAKQKVKTYLA